MKLISPAVKAYIKTTFNGSKTIVDSGDPEKLVINNKVVSHTTVSASLGAVDSLIVKEWLEKYPLLTPAQQTVVNTYLSNHITPL